MSNGVTKNASVAIYSNPPDNNCLYIHLENLSRPNKSAFLMPEIWQPRQMPSNLHSGICFNKRSDLNECEI